MISLNQSNTGRSLERVVRALTEGQVSTAGKYTDLFEQRLADYLGVSDCIATNSGTSALHLALLACGVEENNKVFIPALTFVATRNVVEYIKAKPIVRDVNKKTWNMINYRYLNGFIFPVGLYGNPFLYDFARNYTILDNAECLGSEPIGHIFDYACYSFNGNKIITTGGGGAIVGRNLDRVRKLLVNNGGPYNYRMPSLNAALGLEQLEHLDDFLAKKRRFNEIYRNELDNLVTFQEATEGSNPSWWFTACLFNQGAEIVQKKLEEREIPTRRIFKPLADLPNANFIYDHGLCLPSSTTNNEKDILKVCKGIRGAI